MRPKIIIWTALGVVIALSFLFFSPVNSFYYNSDNAVHVLMTHYLILPQDLYYWGQDRLGSLLPILSHVTEYTFGLPSIYAVSFVQYLLLLVIWLTFSQLLSSTINKLFLAVILFFPLNSFVELILVGHPYTPSLALIGCALLCVSRLTYPVEKRLWLNLILVLGVCVSLVLSFWVSEISVVFIAPILIYFLIILYGYKIRLRTSKSGPSFLLKGEWDLSFNTSNLFLTFIALVALAGSYQFVIYAKQHATKQAGYQDVIFNTVNESQQVFLKYINNLVNALTFSGSSIFVGVGGILFLVCLIYLLLLEKKIVWRSKDQNWFRVFAIVAILHFLILFTSHWVYVNGSPERYASSLYFIVWLLLLLRLDQTNPAKNKVLYAIVAITVFCNFIGSVGPYLYPKKLPGKYQSYKEIQKLGPAGLIGDYWTSYMLGSMSPGLIACTPHEGQFLRAPRLVDSVLTKPVVYLIKNDWLENFPDRFRHYGFFLESLKQPVVKIGDFELAAYRSSRTKPKQVGANLIKFPATSLPTQCGGSKLIRQENLFVLAISDSLENSPCFFSYGPYMELGKGYYKVTFTLSTTDHALSENIARLDLYGEGFQGPAIDIRGTDFFDRGKKQNFEIQFSTAEAVKNFEARIFYQGVGSLMLHEASIEKLNDHERVFTANDMNTGCGKKTLSANELIIESNIAKASECFFVYGPYTTLDPGSYEVTFEVGLDRPSKKDRILVLELFANGQYYASRALSGDNFNKEEEFSRFKLELSIAQEVKNFETRIVDYGLEDLKFRRVKIERIK